MDTKSLYGMIEVFVPASMEEVLNRSCRAGLLVYDLHKEDNGVCFSCLLEQRKKIKECFSDGKILKVTGIAGWLAENSTQPFRWFLLIWIVVLYFVLSHTLIRIDFQSTSDVLKHRVMEYLNQKEIGPGSFITASDFEIQLKQQLKNEFLHELSWVEVTRKGSVLSIRFNHKETAQISEFSNEALVSYKHAVIVKFDVLHGFKCVQLNQVVHPGDVLVRPYLVDSKGETVSLYVSGKVYGLTWTSVECQIDSDQDLTVLDFLRLLYGCRKQIEMEVDEDERVLKENILQVDKSEGTIRMTVHYTCLEDITKQ